MKRARVRWMALVCRTAIGAIAILGGSTRATLAVDVDCSSTVLVATTPYNFTGDYYTTSTNPCLRVVQSNATVNLKDFRIVCKRSGSDCGPAVQVEATGVTVKNGDILSDDTVSSVGGFEYGVLSTGANTLVDDVEIDNAFFATHGVDKVFSSVASHCGPYACLMNLFLPTNAAYRNNYVQGGGIYGAIFGAGGGSSAIIEKNYVQADAGGSGIVVTSGDVDIERNIIDADYPIYGGSTVSGNLCRDDGLCPPPSSPFSLAF